MLFVSNTARFPTALAPAKAGDAIVLTGVLAGGDREATSLDGTKRAANALEQSGGIVTGPVGTPVLRTAPVAMKTYDRILL
jgi:hypothetical protein